MFPAANSCTASSSRRFRSSTVSSGADVPTPGAWAVGVGVGWLSGSELNAVETGLATPLSSALTVSGTWSSRSSVSDRSPDSDSERGCLSAVDACLVSIGWGTRSPHVGQNRSSSRSGASQCWHRKGSRSTSPAVSGDSPLDGVIRSPRQVERRTVRPAHRRRCAHVELSGEAHRLPRSGHHVV